MPYIGPKLKIKLLEDMNPATLEEKVNGFLGGLEMRDPRGGIELVYPQVSVQYRVSTTSHGTVHYAAVFYYAPDPKK